MRMKTLFPRNRMPIVWLISVLLSLLPPAVHPAHADVIRDLRIGNQKDYIRFVLESDRPLTVVPSVDVSGNRLQVLLEGIINTIPLPRTETLAADILKLDLSSGHAHSTIQVDLAFSPTSIQTFMLTSPHRFIIDVYRPVMATSLKTGPLKTPPGHLPRQLVSSERVEQPTPPSRQNPVDTKEGEKRSIQGWQFQQKLIIALILGTSFIAIALIVLIGLKHGGKPRPKPPSWQEALPQERDATIEDLDKKIREQFKFLEKM